MEEAYGAPFPIISRSAAALLLNFDRAFGKVPDLHCFNRCTVAARTLARLLRRCYPTRDCCRCYVASRIPQDTRSPWGSRKESPKIRRGSQPWQDPTACATTSSGRGWETGPGLRISLSREGGKDWHSEWCKTAARRSSEHGERAQIGRDG